MKSNINKKAISEMIVSEMAFLFAKLYKNTLFHKCHFKVSILYKTCLTDTNRYAVILYI